MRKWMFSNGAIAASAVVAILAVRNMVVDALRKEDVEHYSNGIADGRFSLDAIPPYLLLEVIESYLKIILSVVSKDLKIKPADSEFNGRKLHNRFVNLLVKLNQPCSIASIDEVTLNKMKRHVNGLLRKVERRLRRLMNGEERMPSRSGCATRLATIPENSISSAST